MKKAIIERVDLSADASSVVFADIPQNYDHLFLLVDARTDRSSIADHIRVTALNATGNFRVYAYGDGSGASASYQYSEAAGMDGLSASGNNSSGSAYGNSKLLITNYASTESKAVLADGIQQNETVEAYQDLSAGVITTSSSITQLTLTSAFGSNILAKSTLTLYGVIAGSDGSTTVS